MIIFCADFVETGGTFSFFKSVCQVLMRHRILFCVYVNKENKNAVKKFFKLKKIKAPIFIYTNYKNPLFPFFGIKTNYMLETIFNYLYFFLLFLRKKPKLVIYSSGGLSKIFLLALPFKIIFFYHSLQTKNLNKLQKNIIKNSLNKYKKVFLVSKAARNCFLRSCCIAAKDSKNISYLYNTYLH